MAAAGVGVVAGAAVGVDPSCKGVTELMCTCMCLECEIESCYLQTGILMRNLCIPVQCTHKIKITLSIKDQFCCNE